MTHKNHAFQTSFRGLGLLFWCFALPLLPGKLNAQCAVYFSYCPGDITITDCDDSGFEEISWPEPIAATTGGCVNFNMIQTSGPAQGTLVASPGTYTVTYAAGATDMATGKKAKAGCTITIHVESDNTPPVFTYCPPDITLYTGNELTAPGLWSTPIVEDNCDANVTVKTKTPCNTEFKPGVYHVEYKAVDAAGNVAWCQFTVTVILGFQKPAVERDEQHLLTIQPVAITLSPNPFKDWFLLSVDRSPESALDVRVFDMQGGQVRFQQWESGQHTLRIGAENLAPGVYFVKINAVNGAFISALRAVKL